MLSFSLCPLQKSSYAMDRFSGMAIEIDRQLNLRDASIVEEQEAERSSQQYVDDDDGYEFSFACEEVSSPISAEDVFHNGQIRPLSPLLRGDAVEAPSEEFSADRSDSPAEDVDEDSGEKITPSAAAQACRKSNSTGFSRLWRFRDSLIRSQSDGKETFVFLTENGAENDESATLTKMKKKESARTEKKCGSLSGKRRGKAADAKTPPSSEKTTSSSSYAMQYGKNGGKDKERRRSYLPYRQDLVGFFMSASAISRNVHPY